MTEATKKKFDAVEELHKLLTEVGVGKMLQEADQTGLFRFVRDQYGTEYLDFSKSSNSHFAAALSRSLQDCIGAQRVQAMRMKFPMDDLAKHKNKWIGGLVPYGYIAAAFDENGDPISEKSPEIASILKLLESKIKDIEDAVERQVAKGEITFDDLPFYYKRGKEVFFQDEDGELVGGTVAMSEVVRTWFGTTYLAVHIDMIHGLHGELVPGLYKMSMAPFDGTKKLEDLSIQPVTDDIKKKLTERGRLYVKAVVAPTYLSYSGQVSRHSWYGDQTFRAEGRVMIDVGSFKRVDSDQFQQEMRYTGVAGTSNYSDEVRTKVLNYKVEEKDLWRTFPYVYGFSFRAKRWGRMTVSQMSEINWRSDSFDKLVLDEEQKKMVKALVEHNDGSFTDIIEGKGGGCIFLLHGPPGQGKTLTAETIAELLKRPLYAISVGELGVTPDELEERLRVILDVATVWNAVILLDEADIYLEARDEKDITRNAMVGVFLRLLEYHHGVLFLTTNRVKNIDTAFYSRISVALHFEKGGDDKRIKIWENLLASAGLKGLDAKLLAAHEINGRQIKNAIRLSQTLAKAEDKPVDTAALERVIKLMTAFDRERSDRSSI